MNKMLKGSIVLGLSMLLLTGCQQEDISSNYDKYKPDTSTSSYDNSYDYDSSDDEDRHTTFSHLSYSSVLSSYIEIFFKKQKRKRLPQNKSFPMVFGQLILMYDYYIEYLLGNYWSCLSSR